MSRLLVNADDFGLHPDINRGILQCVAAGVVDSVSCVMNGAAAAEVARPEWRAAGTALGVHLALTGEPWLTDGRRIAGWRALLGRLTGGGPAFLRRVRAEWERQLAAFLGHGVTPAHLDSHQHVHLLPGLWPLCLELQAAYRIPRVRLPLAPELRLARRTPAGLLLHALARRRRRDAPGAWPCIGLAHSGHYTWARLAPELRAARGRDVELITHPGVTTPGLQARYAAWGYAWSAERETLLDPRFRAAREDHARAAAPAP